ncbi:MAG: PilZ domain-containing protein [Candidatus Gygaella obscura]|nr:PilZ domain-containing protein [Candidatus Gygaella obscura]
MNIRFRKKEKIIILDISGSFDENCASFIESVGRCLKESYQDILCNFEEVTSIDYMGISGIMIAYKEVVNNHGRMKFVGVPVHLMNLFVISGIDKTIDILPTQELALNAFKEDRNIEQIKKLRLRRRFKRLPIDIKVELKDKFVDNEVCFKASVFNLSALGCYVYGCDKFNLGDSVLVSIDIDNDTTLILDAKIVWISDKDVQRSIHPGMGVAFCDISSSDQKKLIGFIEKNLSNITTND